LTDYGAVVTFGRWEYGEDSSSVSAELVGVDMIYSTYKGAFAVVLKDGTFVTWGDSNLGGDSSSISAALVGVDMICSTLMAFDAVLQDGMVLYQRRWRVLMI